ncbi:peptidylprolyl isomerase [Pedobacter nutrimenti]|jgi:peptidyl-prolyl cis-trans isomerase B (cyclophilin B)|uniref:peptidylprolyl isomerase n=1 Tax=Pedobacter nutrimenti TaxID=1241337 RepID=A0A318UJ97_9SPHI|nr:peptidylprolyl isomerase [Pedobacter nutrimenti]PYF75650.1 peptidyl-prolyl cis-trans isomerase B (cyclophilin B) [Pedobacter nutrimenti]
MKRILLTLFLTVSAFWVNAQTSFVRLKTNKGNIILMLYDQTPKHRDMFLKMIAEGAYKEALFNRVIKAFVSQAGELDDTILNREKAHPESLKRFAAEIKPGLFHKKGALGAGRDDNPEKASYFSQIYLVAGKKQTDAQLDALEQKKGIHFTARQREIYKKIGGTPHLDGDYTVFGEVIDGMEVADAINQVPTQNDLPVSPVVFDAQVLSKKEASKYRNMYKTGL